MRGCADAETRILYQHVRLYKHVLLGNHHVLGAHGVRPEGFEISAWSYVKDATQ